jgi:hypothetical protein
MSDIEQGREHGAEPVRGLPARLPKGEHIIWQGSPEASAFMRDALKSRWIAAYFLIAALWWAAVGVNDGVAPGGILMQLGYVALLAAAVFGLMHGFARAVAKTSVYTITNRRVVMRVGVALSASFNLPYAQITGADFRVRPDGSGNIALSLKPGHGLSSAVFWPHQKGRVWAALSPEMICLKDVSTIAAMLALQLQAHQARHATMDGLAPDEQPVPAIRPTSGARPVVSGAALHPAE